MTHSVYRDKPPDGTLWVFITPRGEGDMQFEDRQVRLEDHAHVRYCERVALIDYEALYEIVSKAISEGNEYHKDDCIQIDSVWYTYWTGDETITLTTCYGRMLYDLPAALKWQKHNKDRIRLITGGEVR